MDKIAIITALYESRAHLQGFHDSLIKASYPLDKITLILVNNEPKEDYEALASKYDWQGIKVKHINPTKNAGFAQGNNLGYRQALAEGAEYIYLLNDDTEVEAGFLTEALEVMKSDDKIAAVQSRLMIHGKDGEVNSMGNSIHYLGFAFSQGGYAKYQPGDFPEKSREIAYASGAACLLKVSALQEVGLFDEEFFMYHEDTDLGWKLRLAGYKSAVARDSVVRHKYLFSQSIQKYYYMERNRIICFFTNYKPATIILLLPMLLFFEAGTFAYSFVNGWWKEKFRVYFYFYGNDAIRHLFARRKFIKKIRRAPDKEVAACFVSEISFQEVSNPLLNLIANPASRLYWALIKPLIYW